MMELARQSGIEVPETRLVERELVDQVPDAPWGDETHAYAIRRFDRDGARGLIHIEDLAQVRNQYPENKYAGSFETVAGLVYRGRDTRALQEFVRRLAFNVCIGNGDSHLKNWSLIYRDPRRPTLAPAYDLVATFVYRPTSAPPEDLGLKFDGTKRFERVTLASFRALDERLSAKADLADVAAETARGVRDHWPAVEHLLLPNEALRHRVGERLLAESERLLSSRAG